MLGINIHRLNPPSPSLSLLEDREGKTVQGSGIAYPASQYRIPDRERAAHCPCDLAADQVAGRNLKIWIYSCDGKWKKNNTTITATKLKVGCNLTGPVDGL